MNNILSKFRRHLIKRKEIKFYSSFIKKGDLCFDVGANKGDKTEVFLEIGAKVLAVEPQSHCVKMLKDRFKNNKNLFIVDKGLSDGPGEMKLNICKDFDFVSTFSSKWKNEGRFKDKNWEESEVVEITTLDALIQKYGIPSFCKIDVEGFELQVLNGLNHPIKTISLEFTKEFLDDSLACINFLKSIEKIKVNCSIGESRKMLFDDWTTQESLFDKLVNHPSETLWGDIYVRSEI